ncbi:ornithine cyclodeaminase family protein [Sphingopyxis sp.]|uniref:ornithine cyclodeaminase family protein n=1 Tax=Sphingopyxis sp. TaxID=1908224 RepID=UPI001DCAD61E|nr:ornithine cyclodeaminase family protein [Sphingopyxis sp.]MBW8296051.1 ornithine cyclodeaminase family protein [Sphingopyxis sp.]
MFDAPQVRQLLPVEECIDLMRDAFLAVARGETGQLLRSVLMLPGDDGACFGTMSGYMSEPNVFGVKVNSVFPANFGTEYPSHQGVMLLFERQHGELVAMLDAGEITAVRTAAASAAATDALARGESSHLAVLGYGRQASMHVASMRAVRPINKLTVWGRSAGRARAFAEEQQRLHAVAVEIAPDVEQAIAHADIVCTTTAAAKPILKGDWIPAGCHLNVVGSSMARFREIDTRAVVRSRFFVDYRPMCLREGGEFLKAVEEAAVTADHIVGEVGEVLAGTCEGRRDAGEITVFKSLGMPVEDIAAAHYVLKKALMKD